MRTEDRAPRLIKPPGATCPMPVGRDTDISQIAESCLEAVAQDQYDGPDDRFTGKTRLEATILSLAMDAPHDPDARREFLDRTMGKPKQRIDSTSLNVTLTGFLEQLAEEEAKTVDAEFTATPDDEEDMFR